MRVSHHWWVHSLYDVNASNYHTHIIFMETISLQGKTNFFESRVSQYQMRGVVSRAEMAKDGDMAKRVAEERVLNIGDDF